MQRMVPMRNGRRRGHVIVPFSPSSISHGGAASPEAVMRFVRGLATAWREEHGKGKGIDATSSRETTSGNCEQG